MKYAGLIAIAAMLALVVMAARPAYAGTEPRSVTQSGVYFGQNVVVDRDQEIDGDITVIGGDADIAGTVDGDVNVIGGNLIRESGSVISGHPNVVGGDVTPYVPFVPSAGAATMAHENAKLMVRLAYSIVVVLVFLIFPVRVRTALDRVEHHPGLSAAVGTLAIIASVPIAVLLFISFVGWPLLPLELVAYVAGVLIGQAALGILIGRRLLELVHPHNTPTPLMALILGLVVICAAEILPVVGWMVTALVWLVGLGAAVLAFIRETTFMGGGSAPVSGARPPISGPPMTTT